MLSMDDATRPEYPINAEVKLPKIIGPTSLFPYSVQFNLGCSV